MQTCSLPIFGGQICQRLIYLVQFSATPRFLQAKLNIAGVISLSCMNPLTPRSRIDSSSGFLLSSPMISSWYDFKKKSMRQMVVFKKWVLHKQTFHFGLKLACSRIGEFKRFSRNRFYFNLFSTFETFYAVPIFHLPHNISSNRHCFIDRVDQKIWSPNRMQL